MIQQTAEPAAQQATDGDTDPNHKLHDTSLARCYSSNLRLQAPMIGARRVDFTLNLQHGQALVVQDDIQLALQL
jgi:hypothetical protein